MILPGYRAMFTSLDVILNRNTVDIEEVETYEERVSRLTVNFDRSRTTIKTALWNKGQTIPMVFVCTTLWHENEAEMTTLLTSLIRLVKTVEDRRTKNLSDFYNIEMHILFDNCYEIWTDDTGNQHKVVNFFVKQFKRILKKLVIQERVSEVINTEVLMVTPYGGRIDYMFGHTSMHVHLKDAELVQKGKRWSQVMYMYYLIGWKMDACKFSMPGGQGKSEHLERKKTYILALDGDVRFKPSALELCLERMLRNDKVAAVCGRIHPVGGGWINWYQRFEYGVGHWLQKATEHVLGCVLCSPGCFSLMRVHHLRFNNVMARYRQYAETPMQKLQYDMGEDRWLCTLMLMQGGRIEYEAGSHCYTFAPEELEEFFKQRKRWGPSTTANIYDLVQQQWLARKNNPYISFPYVCYQGFNLIFTIIGLSTTLMMLSEAFNFAIKMPTDQAALAYIIICGPVIGLATFLTFVYAILMVTVMIGLLVDAIECVADPNVLFFLALAVIYGIAALSHGEIVNLICGLIYFMFIPSCFIFLQLYMVSNLNDISWGTRQNAGEASAKKKDMGIFGGMIQVLRS
ncbi:unnamed protein product [Oikopleura dioica]|uniref:chitin synthase n=1 Tax=Oikopleura dioica TaxID=34765 RepID=E4X720_OIKDI|nr:unnamed protein product [Oikopleura dioica]